MHFVRNRKLKSCIACRIGDRLGAYFLVLGVIFVPGQIPVNFDPRKRLAIVILDMNLYSIWSPWSGDPARGCSQYEWICRGSVKGLDSRREYLSTLGCDFILKSKPMQRFHFRGRNFLKRPNDLEHHLLLAAREFDRLCELCPNDIVRIQEYKSHLYVPALLNSARQRYCDCQLVLPNL